MDGLHQLALEWLAPNLPKVGGRLLQAEDELAAINMIIGASYGGTPALTATSGPGLSLMIEALGLATAAEIPIHEISIAPTDEQVRKAIVVIVAPRTAVAGAQGTYRHTIGDPLKLTVTRIPIQKPSPISVREVNIQETIAVDVSRGTT